MKRQNRWLTAIVGMALALVLVVPALSQAQIVKKIDSFEILADLSGSMTSDWKASDCGAMEKFNAQKQLLAKMNNAIPALDYNAAFRRFGFKFYIAGPEDWSKLEFGPADYKKPELAAVIDKLRMTQGITPLGPAIVASDSELSIWPGCKALIIFSDFKKDPDFGKPVEEAKKLKDKYGNDLKIYTISFGFGDAELAVARGVAEVGGGKNYNACTVLKDQAAFDCMMEDIFFATGPSQGCPDQDGDGVCDDVDQCPNTPKGAVVDERGCWIGAYESFFDFNKAEIKKQYLPNIQAAALILKQDPTLAVSVDGHTDSVGSEQYNYNLGLKRAQTVKMALAKFGVNPNRLKVASFGKTRPIADNNTEEGRAKNRRVEITVSQVPVSQQKMMPRAPKAKAPKAKAPAPAPKAKPAEKKS